MAIPPKGPSRPPSMLRMLKASVSWVLVHPNSLVRGRSRAPMP